MKIAGFIPVDFTAWRGHAASVVMTPGCNFRCGYCMHSVLVEAHAVLDEKEPEKVLDEIHREADDITAVVITGGEPTLQKGLLSFCRKLRETGLDIKLETNGSKPDVLEALIRKKLVDYIAMDIKAPFDKYGKVAGAKAVDARAVQKSRDMLYKGDCDYEFRTTVIPDLVDETDIKKMLWNLQHAKRYVLQQFDPETCLDEEYQTKPLVTFRKLKEIAKDLDFKGEIIVRTEDREEIIRERS